MVETELEVALKGWDMGDRTARGLRKLHTNSGGERYKLLMGQRAHWQGPLRSEKEMWE